MQPYLDGWQVEGGPRAIVKMATLKKVNAYAKLIHMDLASNSKRLKNAEELMHHTSYRLTEYLHKASNEDRDTLQATLKQLDQVHDELLAQVFKH